jgi:hypothetical protein
MARRPPAAQTAFGPMFVTAVEQHTPPERRIVSAPRYLRPAGRDLAVSEVERFVYADKP